MAMYNKKHIFIALAVIAVILVSGCVGTQKKAETPLSAKPFVGGTNGLVASFFPGAPADEVLQQKSPSKDAAQKKLREQVIFTVSVENKGETAVTAANGKVTLVGINTGTSAWDITPATTQSIGVTGTELEGVKKVGNTLIPGGQTTVDFTSQNGYQGDIEGQFQFKATANVCYEYKSQGVATVCETPNLLRPPVSGQTTCKPSGPKTVFNKGAPIQVTSVEQIPFGKDTIGFQIKIKNAGTGSVYAPSERQCLEKYTKNTKTETVVDRVTLVDVTLGGTTIKVGCNPLRDYTLPGDTPTPKTINLINGEATILCRHDLSAGGTVSRSGTVEDLLVVDLMYDYLSQATKTFTVVSTE